MDRHTALLICAFFFTLLPGAPESQGQEAAVILPDIVKLAEYPPVARWSRLEGTATVRCVLDRAGAVVSAIPTQGPEVLAKHSAENARAWKFSIRDSKSDRFTVDLIYEYRLKGPESHRPQDESVTIQYPNRVIVVTNPPQVQTGEKQ